MSFSGWLDAHRRSIELLFLLLVLGGAASVGGLPVGLFPRTTFPRVVVSADAGDRPAGRMIIEVTRPLEEAVRGVPGVRSLRSNTSRGSCDISVDFDWGVDMVAATLQVESAIARVLPSLPPGLEFRVRRMDPTVFPVIGLSLTTTSATRSLVELKDLALYDLAPLLSTIRGVARVGVQGGRTEELQVLVDPARLEAVGLTLEDVAHAVSATNIVRSVGRIEDQEALFLVLSDTQIQRPQDVSDVILREGGTSVVRLGDVASVRTATAPEWTRVTADGRDAVLVNVYQQPDGNTVQIARDLEERLAAFKSRAASDVRIGVWYDQSDLILASTASVRDSIGIGVVLAVGVLMLFLRNWRVTLVAAAAAPCVIAVTLLLLNVLGMTVNIMTLGGMAASVGLVIDDAIVMVEHILRRTREERGERHAVVLRAAREMAAPLIGSSLATVVIFLPLAYLSGVTGAFFKPLSLTMATALVVSWLTAFVVLPLLCERLLRPEDARVEDVGPWFARLLERYDTLLRRLLSRPGLVVVPIAISALLGGIAFRQVGSGFMPAMDEGGFVLDYRAPAGTSLEETDRRLREVEKILEATPEVAAYSRRTGLSLGGHITEANEGDFFVRLHGLPRRPIEAVIDSVREQVERSVPGLEVELVQLMEDLIGDLTAVPQPIEIKLFGAEPALLRETAGRVADAIRETAGAVDVKSGVVLAGDAVEIQVDRDRARLLGLDPEALTRLTSLALQGEVVTEVQRGEKMVGIRVWTADEVRKRVDSIAKLRLRVADGSTVTVQRVAALIESTGQAQITRENLKMMVAVTGRIAGRDLGSVIGDVKQAVGRVTLAPGIYAEYGGLYREQQKSFLSLTIVLGAAVLLVLVLLVYLYERLSVPFAILGSSALAGSAVFPGLWLSRSELNISSMMGLTMIVGISAEAAVFFATQLQELRSRLDLASALREAGRLRLRPILMTGLAAILALLPLALGIGQGAAMLQPLAIAIVSGLVVTVPAVLVVLPVLIYWLETRHGARGVGPGRR
jgi:multidrug efflux pump subunit AcrB